MLTKKSKIKLRKARSKKRNQIRTRKKGGANNIQEDIELNVSNLTEVDIDIRRALYDYSPALGITDGTSLKERELIHVLEPDVDGWIKIKKSDLAEGEGLVPTEYLDKLDIRQVNNDTNNLKKDEYVIAFPNTQKNNGLIQIKKLTNNEPVFIEAMIIIKKIRPGLEQNVNPNLNLIQLQPHLNRTRKLFHFHYLLNHQNQDVLHLNLNQEYHKNQGAYLCLYFLYLH